jgi:hypothetical protein
MRLNDRRFFAVSVVSLFILSASAIFHVSAQSRPQPQAKCPTVRVSCPDSVFVKEELSFVANVTGGDPNVTPTYNWTVSNGSISSGQGTATIQLDLSEVSGDSTVTATVDVGGFARECSTSNSCTTSVMKKAEARKMDEYGKLRANDENARLDNFAIELQNDPTAQGYIIGYGGRIGRAGDGQKAADKAKTYLVKKRGLASDRAMAMDGGHREEHTIELWIVPSGAQPPSPSPTVDPSEVKPAKSAKPAKRKTATRKKA